MNCKSLTLAALLIAAFSHTQLQAAPIYDNGLPTTQNGYSIKDTNWVASDFTLGSAASIGSVGFYFQNYNGITGWNQDIDYAIHANSGGNLGALLASGSGQNVVPTDSGLPWCCGGGNAWEVTFDLETPFAASAGTTYWLKLTGATGPARSAWWVTAAQNGTLISYRNGFLNSNEFAFYLNGAQQVPEPASIAIWSALGVAGLLGTRRRRKAQA